jgi:hypothetical protein
MRLTYDKERKLTKLYGERVLGYKYGWSDTWENGEMELFTTKKGGTLPAHMFRPPRRALVKFYATLTDKEKKEL